MGSFVFFSTVHKPGKGRTGQGKPHRTEPAFTGGTGLWSSHCGAEAAEERLPTQWWSGIAVSRFLGLSLGCFAPEDWPYQASDFLM